MCSNTLAARTGRRTAGRRWLAAGVVLAALSGCQDMYDQPRYEPFQPSTFFDDGASSRPLVAGTVARGQTRATCPTSTDRDLLLTGLKDGLPSRSAPFAVDQAVLEARPGAVSDLLLTLPRRGSATARG